MWFKRFFPAIIAAAVLLAGLGWLWVGRLQLFQVLHYRNLDETVVYPLTTDTRITQDFEAKYPGLYRVELYFDNLGYEDQRLFFHLKDSCSSTTDLQMVEVFLADIPDEQFYPFTFTPIDDSTDRHLCMVLDIASTAGQGEVGVYAINKNSYPDGEVSYEPKPTAATDLKTSARLSATHFIWLPLVEREAPPREISKDLAFQLYYRGPVLETLAVLLARLAANKPFVLGWAGFYPALLFVYLVVLVVFLITILRKQRDLHL